MKNLGFHPQVINKNMGEIFTHYSILRYLFVYVSIMDEYKDPVDLYEAKNFSLLQKDGQKRSHVAFMCNVIVPFLACNSLSSHPQQDEVDFFNSV